MKKKIVLVAISFIIFIFTLFGYIYLTAVTKESDAETITINIEPVPTGIAVIEETTIYGRFFNIKGYIQNIELKDLKLVIYSRKKTYEYELNQEVEDTKISFSTNEVINEGINLDNLDIGEYNIYLKSTIGEDEVYYSLTNESKYKDNLDYYTLTKNNSNNHITINDNGNLKIKVENSELPEDVYDIIIDAGHGGRDAGAVDGKEYEKTYTLMLSKLIKEDLEKAGYKVAITRTEDKWLDKYGENGRVAKVYESHAKYMFSIHLNATENFVEGTGGVEVYSAPNCDLTLAKIIADKTVENTGTQYSKNTKYKVGEGIYVRTFTEYEKKEYSKDAIAEGFTPYPYTDNTPYYYMIRETGGIITNAYIDGRDKSKDANLYYDSNIGVESYIVEFGYLISDIDLTNVKTKSNEYAEVIRLSLEEHLN